MGIFFCYNTLMKRILLFSVWCLVFSFFVTTANAQSSVPVDEGFIGNREIPQQVRDDSVVLATESADLTATASAEIEPTPFPTARPDITQSTEETLGPLEALINAQTLSSPNPFNFVRHLIRSAVNAGVPANTIVLLLLLPLVVSMIAAARHVVGLRGFGIFLPAALGIVFLATGPIIGLAIFMVIVTVSTLVRIVLRKLRVKLQYLPRMSLLLWFVVAGVLGTLFLAPLVKHPDFTNVSIFPVLILVLLAEDFSKVQLGKSAGTAINLASETIVMALVSYVFLTTESLRYFALAFPELLLISVLVFDILLGKYVGLRVTEYWRYRKLLSSDK